MRHVKIVLVITLVVNLLLLICFVLDVYYSSPTFKGYYYRSERYPDIESIKFLVFLIESVMVLLVLYSMIFFVYAIFRRSFATAGIYVLIFLMFITSPALEMSIKWRMYEWFPELCQHSLRQGQHATICGTETKFNAVTDDGEIGDIHTYIIYNPDDEMSLPESRWSSELKHKFGGYPVQHVGRHIYLQKD
ncbi:MAG: hypothetical protein ACYC43_13380 [Burkholderiales bacterium]